MPSGGSKQILCFRRGEASCAETRTNLPGSRALQSCAAFFSRFSNTPGFGDQQVPAAWLQGTRSQETL